LLKGDQHAYGSNQDESEPGEHDRLRNG
jgi:hypothetical protein